LYVDECSEEGHLKELKTEDTVSQSAKNNLDTNLRLEARLRSTYNRKICNGQNSKTSIYNLFEEGVSIIIQV
jgi:hypothetical protein